jgi:hypothetical protein
MDGQGKWGAGGDWKVSWNKYAFLSIFNRKF